MMRQVGGTEMDVRVGCENGFGRGRSGEWGGRMSQAGAREVDGSGGWL